MLERICVFCGSRADAGTRYLEASRDLGRLLAERGVTLVYGGANTGLMGDLAEAALQAGGRVIGVVPEWFPAHIIHRGLSELHMVPSIHKRKQMMRDLSDAFIALPGGLGTLEELTELMARAQLGIHRKPYGLLNTSGYFSSFLAFLEHIADESFIECGSLGALHASEDPKALLKLLAESRQSASQTAAAAETLANAPGSRSRINLKAAE